MMSRIQLRQFLAVVDTGSFTRAANQLNVAQPTLSAGIASLEAQLGTQLFVRERRRIQLTEAGNRLLPYARSIERDFHLAEAQITSLDKPLRPIRLGVLHSIPTRFLENAVAAYDGVEPVEITEGSETILLSALSQGAVDLALTIVRTEEKRFDTEVLLQEDYRLALAADHPLALASEISANDVAGETMIARRSCEILGETSRFFTEHGVRPRFGLRSPNDDRVMALVRGGLGVTVAPQSFKEAGIAMIPILGFGFERSLGLLYGMDWTSHYGNDHALIRSLRNHVMPYAELC